MDKYILGVKRDARIKTRVLFSNDFFHCYTQRHIAPNNYGFHFFRMSAIGKISSGWSISWNWRKWYIALNYRHIVR
jgi:hypothetical protein